MALTETTGRTFERVALESALKALNKPELSMVFTADGKVNLDQGVSLGLMRWIARRSDDDIRNEALALDISEAKIQAIIDAKQPYLDKIEAKLKE